MKKTKKDLSREEQESKEGQDNIVVEGPKDRVQQKAQIPNADNQGEIKPSADVEPYMKKKIKARGFEVKQDKVAEVVTKAAPSGSIPGVLESNALVFSGDESVIAGAAASTPVVAKDTRSESRFSRKMDVYTKGIDYNPSEQFIRDEDGTVSLSEQKDEVQGYRGTIRNNNTLVQKVAGAVPGSINFERSLDIIEYDLFMFSRGQVNKSKSELNIDYYDTPKRTKVTKNWAKSTGAKYYNRYGTEISGVKDVNEAIINGYYTDSNLVRGNYWNKTFIFHIDTKGRIDQFYFNTVDANINNIPNEIVNKSASHALTHINRCELARQRIDQEAGDEVSSKYWSPLARAIPEPSANLAYLNDIEAMGNHIFTAYKAASTAQARQLNNGAKNGIHPSRSMKEYLLGDVIPSVSSAIYSSIDTPFTLDWYAIGAASFAIELNDTTDKYKTIGNALTLPLSIRSYIQTADNTMDIFMVDKEYAAMLNANIAFSTIDHDYDPLSPVLATARVGIIDPYDWNALFAFKSLDNNGNPILENLPITYDYSDLRNTYTVEASAWMLKGLYRFLLTKLPKILKLIKAKGNSYTATTFKIPIRYSFDYPSLWELLLLGATKFMVYERTNSMIDILRISENYSYPFNDIVPIKSANPLNNVNYTIKSLTEPLMIKTMLSSAAIRIIWPELFTTIAEDTAVEWTILPWYFNQQDYEVSGAVPEDLDTDFTSVRSGDSTMSYPTIASGVRSSYADVIYSMSERDIRLCLDRITWLGTDAIKVIAYKYDLSADGIPVVPFGSVSRGLAMNPKKFLSLPRELGWSFISPAGLLSPVKTQSGQNAQTDATTPSKFAIDGGYYYNEEFDSYRVYSSFRLKYYFASGKTSINKKILDPIDINIERGTSFAQDFNYICATPYYNSLNDDPGFRLSIGSLIDSSGKFIDGVSKFSPFVIPNGSKGDTIIKTNNLTLNSLQKGLWTRVQRLPFAISPWDSSAAIKTALVEDGNPNDIFDFMYMFGLKGFRASDYSEDVYNKENTIITLGYAYVDDYFVKDSPLYKDALTYTNI